jgi:hypothetical protein
VCNVFHKSTVAISTSVALSVKRLGVNKDWARVQIHPFVQSKLSSGVPVLRHVRDRIGY